MFDYVDDVDVLMEVIATNNIRHSHLMGCVLVYQNDSENENIYTKRQTNAERNLLKWIAAKCCFVHVYDTEYACMRAIACSSRFCFDFMADGCQWFTCVFVRYRRNTQGLSIPSNSMDE